MPFCSSHWLWPLAWQSSPSPRIAADCHRVQFGKQNCMECHKKNTPEGYRQWVASKHGINNVKCGICHGDAVNYRAMPDKAAVSGAIRSRWSTCRRAA